MSDTVVKKDVDVPAQDNGLPSEKELELELMLHERNEQIIRLVVSACHCSPFVGVVG